MTEYEEITQDYDIKDCEREIKHQLELGYVISDSFPQYLIDLINHKKHNDGCNKVSI